MIYLGRDKIKNFNGKDKIVLRFFKYFLFYVEFRFDKAF